MSLIKIRNFFAFTLLASVTILGIFSLGIKSPEVSAATADSCGASTASTSMAIDTKTNSNSGQIKVTLSQNPTSPANVYAVRPSQAVNIPGANSSVVASTETVCIKHMVTANSVYLSDTLPYPLTGLSGSCTGSTVTNWTIYVSGSATGKQDVTNTCGKTTSVTVKVTLQSSATDPLNTGSATTDENNTSLKCQASITNPLTWLVCPMIAAANKAVNVFDGQISCLLQVDLTDVFGSGSNSTNPYAATCGSSANTAANGKSSSDAYYAAWNTFRSFALALMVIAGLVMVISQAIGFELLDAYTIRKVLPRLLIAGVGITLSWQIMQFLVQITNAVGYGIRDIIYFPFKDFGAATISGFTSSAVGSATILGGLTFLGLAGIGTLALTALLGVLVAFITLVLRKLIIIFLLMMAPIALACYILPNTQKFWKMWWDTLSKALLVFPIIAAMIAVGHVFAATSYGSGNGGPTSQIIAFIAYFLPYFLIPTAVKMAGGTMGAIAGMVNNRAQGGFNMLKKQRAGIIEKNMHNIKSNNRFEGGTEHNFRGKLNRGLQATALVPAMGVNPTKWKARVGAATSLDAEHQRAAMMEDKDYTWSKDDHLNRGANETDTDSGLKQWLLDRDREAVLNGDEARYKNGENDVNFKRDVERVRTMRSKYEPAAFKQATFLNAAAGGTAYKGSAEVWEAAGKVAGNDNLLLSTLVGNTRSLTMNSGRVDQGGAGFGDTLGVAQQLRDGKITLAEADSKLKRAVIQSQGANVISHPSMKKGAIKNLMPEYRKMLSEAYASGDQLKLDRQLAIVAHLYDNMANNSPQNAQVVREDLFAWNPESSPEQSRQDAPNNYDKDSNVRAFIELARNDPEFLAYRRELNAQEERFRQNTGGSGTGVPTTPSNSAPLTPGA